MFSGRLNWIQFFTWVFLSLGWFACTKNSPPLEIKSTPVPTQAPTKIQEMVSNAPAPSFPTPRPNDPTYVKLRANLDIMNAEDIVNYSKGLHCVFQYWTGTIFDWKEESPDQYCVWVKMNSINPMHPDMALKGVPKTKVDLLKKGDPITFSGTVNEVINHETYGNIFGVTETVIY